MEGSDDAISRELRAALHEEINRLPQEARMALVVCDLQGRSSRSAAKQLGWTAVRLERRLEQARRRLHQRLALHGVFLAAAHEVSALLHLGKPVISRRLIEETVARASRRRMRYGKGRARHLPEDCDTDRPPSVGVWSAEQGR